MKVYIAASLIDREEAKKVRESLAAIGVSCTSRWLDEHGVDPLENPSLCYTLAQMDLEDIDRADAVVFLQGNQSSSGKAVELGYCIANRKVVLHVGSPRTVFSFMRTIIRFDTVNDMLHAVQYGRRFIEAVA